MTCRRRRSSRRAWRPVTVSASRWRRSRELAQHGRQCRRHRGSPPSGSSPDGLMSASNGVSRTARRKRRGSARHRRRPASASRWMTAFVEPPIAASARIPFSNASRVRIFEGRRSCSTISTIRRPASSAPSRGASRRAGSPRPPGSSSPVPRTRTPSSTPCPSSCSGPACGPCTLDLAHSPRVICPARSASVYRQQSRARSDVACRATCR